MSGDHERMMEMAGRYVDGAATADEVRVLEAALRDDAAFRRAFLRYVNVDAALVAGAEGLGSTPIEVKGMRRWWGWRIAVGIAAIVLVAVTLLWRPWGGKRGAGAIAAVPPAVLVASTDARWADPDVELSLRSGDTPSGLLRLEAGVAEFRFTRGATAVVLGPAAVRFTAANEMFVQAGKVLCRCPTAESRITLKTPATQVVDLGTEFAVDVAPQGEAATRVAVVSGEVRVGTAETRVLRKGEAAVVGADKVVRLTPLPADTLAALMAADAARAAAGQAGVANVLSDPEFLSLSDGPWVCTDGYVQGGAKGGSVVVFARGHRLWPGVRQTVEVGDVSGRLVVASVDAYSPNGERLVERQSAILKVSFMDAKGREFATSFRHFLQAGEVTDDVVTAQVAAFAPPGTRQITYQLLLTARSQERGSVVFRNPRLVIGAATAQQK